MSSNGPSPIRSSGRTSARATPLSSCAGWGTPRPLFPTPTAQAPVHSADPQDDYLIVLAAVHRTALVSGDKHLLVLADHLPVFSPRGFLDLLARGGRG